MNYSLKELQDAARTKEITIKKTVAIVEGGWVGQPKGAFQILFERGLIDVSQLDQYKMTPTKFDNRTEDKTYSL